ncbi:hypothetical protein SAMN05444161_3143 [Rhizobiales bacterium GAS191]|nr:hypothetical protein SAMN05444161_3143 [Rhizobiales bacterium GAS191]
MPETVRGLVPRSHVVEPLGRCTYNLRMSESKQRARGRTKILAKDWRCIYCTAPAVQVEHMPPRAMFRNKLRPQGMEFAACAACNNGTAAADLVASFFARIGPMDVPIPWQVEEAERLIPRLNRSAPGVIDELFRGDTKQEIWRPTRSGIHKRAVVIRTDGPLIAGYLTAFSAKLGMAIYREHAGAPLPLHGSAFSRWYLNAGLAQNAAEAMLRIMPKAASLQQGKFHVRDQFGYRFNTDARSVVVSLAAFHQGLYVLNIGTAEPDRCRRLAQGMQMSETGPGRLRDWIPRS